MSKDHEGECRRYCGCEDVAPLNLRAVAIAKLDAAIAARRAWAYAERTWVAGDAYEVARQELKDAIDAAAREDR